MAVVGLQRDVLSTDATCGLAVCARVRGDLQGPRLSTRAAQIVGYAEGGWGHPSLPQFLSSLSCEMERYDGGGGATWSNVVGLSWVLLLPPPPPSGGDSTRFGVEHCPPCAEGVVRHVQPRLWIKFRGISVENTDLFEDEGGVKSQEALSPPQLWGHEMLHGARGLGAFAWRLLLRREASR